MCQYYKNIYQLLNQSYITYPYELTSELESTVTECIAECTIRDLRNKSKIINTFIKYKIYDNWIYRIKSSKTKKIGSIEFYKTLYSDEIGNLIYEEIRDRKKRAKPKQYHFLNIDHFFNQKCFREYSEYRNDLINTQINSIIHEFTKSYIFNKKEVIQNMIRYDVDGDWTSRLKNGELYRRDGFSLEALIVKYGKKVGTFLFDQRRCAVSYTKEEYINKYSEEEYRILCNKKRSNLGKEGYIEKYGTETGQLKWNAYYTRWKRGIIKKKMSGTWKDGTSLYAYQQRLGIVDGYIQYEIAMNNRKFSYSLEGFVSKYGEREGSHRYIKYIQQKINNFKSSGPYSEISQELFDEIYYKLDDIKQTNTKYYKRNGEQFFYTHLIKSIKTQLIYVDFKCGNCIIEFDGSYWHKWESVKKNDRERDKFLINSGYKVLRIDENFYRKNKQIVIDDCLNFINENYE